MKLPSTTKNSQLQKRQTIPMVTTLLLTITFIGAFTMPLGFHTNIDIYARIEWHYIQVIVYM